MKEHFVFFDTDSYDFIVRFYSDDKDIVSCIEKEAGNYESKGDDTDEISIHNIMSKFDIKWGLVKYTRIAI